MKSMGHRQMSGSLARHARKLTPEELAELVRNLPGRKSGLSCFPSPAQVSEGCDSPYSPDATASSISSLGYFSNDEGVTPPQSPLENHRQDMKEQSLLATLPKLPTYEDLLGPASGNYENYQKAKENWEQTGKAASHGNVLITKAGVVKVSGGRTMAGSSKIVGIDNYRYDPSTGIVSRYVSVLDASPMLADSQNSEEKRAAAYQQLKSEGFTLTAERQPDGSILRIHCEQKSKGDNLFAHVAQNKSKITADAKKILVKKIIEGTIRRLLKQKLAGKEGEFYDSKLDNMAIRIGRKGGAKVSPIDYNTKGYTVPKIPFQLGLKYQATLGGESREGEFVIQLALLIAACIEILPEQGQILHIHQLAKPELKSYADFIKEIFAEYAADFIEIVGEEKYRVSLDEAFQHVETGMYINPH